MLIQSCTKDEACDPRVVKGSLSKEVLPLPGDEEVTVGRKAGGDGAGETSRNRRPNDQCR